VIFLSRHLSWRREELMELPLVQAGRYAETLKDQQRREAEKVKEEGRSS
jgi:hypothetical protein